MNGGPRGVSAPVAPVALAENVDDMVTENCYRNGIPKDLPNRSKDTHWVKEVDEKEAEENLSLYCKPVELYNIIQQRCEHQPLFLQRCLSYKIHAAWQRRIRMDLAVTGFSTGKFKGKDPAPSNGNIERTVFVTVTRPGAYPAEAGVFEGQVVYQLKESQVVNAGSQKGVIFILPELRKLGQNAKSGDVLLFVIFDTVDIDKEACRNLPTLADFSGRVLWGKLPILSLCLHWLRNTKENGPRAMLDGNGVVTTSNVDLRHGNLQHENSTSGKIIKLSAMAKTATERNLVQLQVRITGAEVGQTMAKEKVLNGTSLRSPVPYSLSHAWRPRFGRVVFHYLYYHGILRKTEVTEDFSCPFCLNGCASFQGLRRHLSASHDLFSFEYLVSGELQVVNVSCRPEVVGPEGNIRDVDGFSDPRVKNFIYWFKGSLHRKRRDPKTPGVQQQQQQQQQLEANGQALTSWIGTISDCAEEQDPQKGDLNDEDMDVSGAVVEVAGTSEHDEEDQVPDGVITLLAHGNIDGAQTEEMKYEQKSRAGKAQETDSVGNVVKQRSAPGQKRQRMKGVLGERAMARTRPSSTFGGACASAGSGQDLEDCGVQQNLSVPNKAAADRPDIHRSHAQLQKRQYFHSHTAQPMETDQLMGDRDSEDEVDTVIADLEDRRMLDDFVDVTPEEKEVMHLWNSFVRRNRVVADGHIPWACGEFSRENAQRFGENPALRRCLMLFLVKLWNHHLVDGPTINRCLATVDLYELK